PFNHEFERYWATCTLEKWPLAGSRWSVTGNLYETGIDRMWEVEGFYEQKLLEILTLEIGTGYALYKEDRYTLAERDHVRFGFLRVNCEIYGGLSARIRYTVERDDEETTHILETALRYRF
ncbi:MAG: hypothetical protein JXA90_13980, partial [Planctomycetes bacterium]|nr:hypothetical protein [Planctomycetota bacterium]